MELVGHHFAKRSRDNSVQCRVFNIEGRAIDHKFKRYVLQGQYARRRLETPLDDYLA
jgi:hypothetical protein